jgi:hypothetical protein
MARSDRGGERTVVTAELGRGADLDLEVAGGQLHLAAGLAQQHVGQDGQRVAPLHDAGDRLQRGQHLGLGRLQNDHVRLFRHWLAGALLWRSPRAFLAAPSKPKT